MYRTDGATKEGQSLEHGRGKKSLKRPGRSWHESKADPSSEAGQNQVEGKMTEANDTELRANEKG